VTLGDLLQDCRDVGLSVTLALFCLGFLEYTQRINIELGDCALLFTRLRADAGEVPVLIAGNDRLDK